MRSRIEVARMLATKAEHDLVVAEACIKQELPLEAFRDPLLGFASYAVDIRYDDEIVVSREEASEGLEIAKRLRCAVHSLLPPQAQP
jgi:hypothetical protein